jgi:hypothetical protein
MLLQMGDIGVPHLQGHLLDGITLIRSCNACVALDMKLSTGASSIFGA